MANSTLVKVITWGLILLIAVTAVGAIAYFTDGFTTDFKTFYVTVDGKDIMTSASGYTISDSNPLKVDVKYTIADEGQNGYSVKVVPNALFGKDFDFTLDGEVYSFQAESDLTEGFEIVYGEQSFTIKPKGNLTQVMAAVYPESDVGNLAGFGYENMFLLIVNSQSGESSVSIAFSLTMTAEGITIVPDQIIF